MKPLTLCMIVRDEEQFLPGCLESVKGVVDRMVIVDTGSTDRTREIARAAGAFVVEHPWNDDFAEARNVAIAHVRDGFLLVLDADERLARRSRAALREALELDFDCGLLPLHNAATLAAAEDDVLSGRARRGDPVLLPRLLRRTPDFAWDGPVHESVTLWLSRAKRRVLSLEVELVHYGSVPDVRAAKKKDERNRILLERRVQAAPQDINARTYLAREYERAGEGSRALAECARAWNEIDVARAGGIPFSTVQLATLYAFLLLRAGRLDDAEPVLARAYTEQPDHPNLNVLRGVLHEQRALRVQGEGALERELAAAETYFRECVKRRGAVSWVETLPGAASWVGWTRLGTVLLLGHRAEEALAAFDAALAEQPQWTEAVLGRAEALCMLGRAEEALITTFGLAQEATPDAWIVTALAALSLGHERDAVDAALEAARRRKSVAPVAPHRGHMLDALLAEIQTSPSAPMGGFTAQVLPQEFIR
ncbi:MAG: glycosyltransferase family 2 protein [Planctomycetes bacterium]|nr:glycosyltransferase family 2 protein [Planctomycetota bacterium]